MRYLLVVLVLTIIFSSLASAQRYDDENIRSPLAKEEKNIVFGDGFESGCWDVINENSLEPYRCRGEGTLWKHAQLQSPEAIKFVTNPVRSGSYSVRFKWLHENPGRWQGDTEQVSNNEKKAMLHAPGIKHPDGAERWYGFSIYFPSEGMKRDKFRHLFFQLHATPDHDLQEPWRQPSAAMTLSDQGLVADWTWDSLRVSPGNRNIVKNRTSIEITGSYEDYLDRWTDIVWHVKEDFSGKPEGLVEIWVDGEKVADYHDILFGYNDELGLYPSYGLYWYQGKGESDHWIFVDEVRIGNMNASYEDVAPGKKY